MSNNEINYFIYARKSSEGEDRQSLSIPSQIEDDTKLQERHGLIVADTITDSASAKIPFNRGGYSSMMKRIKKGEASGIIVWKIDRLARNHLEWGELMHLLQTGVIQSIWTMHREYQSRDSALLIGLEASMATQYSVDLAEVVKRGLYKKLAIGQPPIIAPPGYSNTKNVESGSNSIIPDPERWVPMRKAFDLILTRQYSIGKVASILNNEYNFRTRSSRDRTGSPIAVSVLHRALTNIFYTGYFNYKSKQYKGSYKPMITLEEFDRVQAILGKIDKAKPQKHDFAFTGFIKCGCCGCAITASKKMKKIKTTGEYKTYTFYHCTKRKGASACADKEYTTEKEMLALIEQELETIALLPEWKEWAINMAKADYEDELSKQKKQLKDTVDYEQKLLLELDTLLDLRISKEITEEKYLEKKTEREALLIRVQERRRRSETNVNIWIDRISEILEFAVNALTLFKTGDDELQKSICSQLGRNWVLQKKRLTFTRYKWFYDIENLKNHFEAEKEWLEPISFDKYRETESFRTVYPILSSLRENSRTEWPKRSDNRRVN
jgi:site-specific DNA recombinase